MIEAEKRNADATIRLSNWREQEKLAGAVSGLQRDKTALQGELERITQALAEATAQIAQRDSDASHAQEQVAAGARTCMQFTLTAICSHGHSGTAPHNLTVHQLTLWCWKGLRLAHRRS